MQYFPGNKLTLEHMRAKVEAALDAITTEYTQTFGLVPHLDDIAYVCDACGWWEDTAEALVVVERHYENKQNGVILLEPKLDVQLICPRCWEEMERGPIAAIRKDIFLDQARAEGKLRAVLAAKGRRLILSS
jgi:hypothetical protein